ncbi:MAG: hypothetical protein ACRCT1_12960 [Microcoleaceae cyanobacterium]
MRNVIALIKLSMFFCEDIGAKCRQLLAKGANGTSKIFSAIRVFDQSCEIPLTR